MRSTIAVLVAAIMLGLAAGTGMVRAGPLEDGQAALDRGDYAQAVAPLRIAAQSGDPEVQMKLALALMGQGDEASAREGWALINSLARQGLAVAQYILGRAYLGGDFGAEPDAREGLKWLTRAAEQDGQEGADRAQLELGRYYQRQIYDGDRYSKAKAALAWKWLSRAAAGLEASSAKGDLDAQLALAGLYKAGEGVAPDAARAQQLINEVFAAYLKRADQGDAAAQLRLARLYKAGMANLPFGRSRLLSAEWYRRAADQGLPAAQLELAMLLGPGRLNRRLTEADSSDDSREAYFWLALAVKGLPPARASSVQWLLNQRDSDLTPEQNAELDRRLATWRPVSELPNRDGSPITPTAAQQAEAARLQIDWDPTPEQIAARRGPAEAFDVVVGAAGAKQTVVIYLSAASPHSGRFLREIWPALKAKYADAGQVRFVFRDILTPPLAAAMDGALLAHCAGPERYLASLAALTDRLDSLAAVGDDRAWLQDAAQVAGLTNAQAAACLADPAPRKALAERVDFFGRFEDAVAAPTVSIDGRTLSGEMSLARIDAAIARRLNPPSLEGPHSFAVRLVLCEAGAPGEPAPSPGAIRVPQTDGPDLWLSAWVILTGDMILDAHAEINELTGMPVISFEMSEKGRLRFASATRKSVGERLAIVVDGRVVSAPRIMAPINGSRGEIAGPASLDEAADLAEAIRRSRTAPKP